MTGYVRLTRVLPCLIASCCFATAVSIAADFSAREVTELFHKAKRGEAIDLSGKDLSALDLSGIDFKGAELSGANLFGADLSTSDLRGTKLKGVRLDRAIVLNADFSGANLERASLLRPSLSRLRGAPEQRPPKFAGANLRFIHMNGMLDGADFRGADLTGARMGPYEPRAEMSSMPGTLLRKADFSGAILKDADMTRASLRFSKFVGADLRGVNFRYADLSQADLSGADVTGANFKDAALYGTILEGVRGLDQAKDADISEARGREAGP